MSRSRWLYCFAACVESTEEEGRGGGERKYEHLLDCYAQLLTIALTSSELEEGEMERRVQDSPLFILCSSSSVFSLSACTRERLSASWESSRSRCCSFLRPSSNSSSCVTREKNSHQTLPATTSEALPYMCHGLLQESLRTKLISTHVNFA